MKNVYFTALLIVIHFTLFSQTTKISGIVTDSAGYSLINATVLLLEEDSTMIEFTQTNVEGKYSFSKIPYGNYILKVTYVGYVPNSFPIIVDKKDIIIEKVILNEINVQLMEVVVKAARAPLKMRGDTIEFDITQFKVPQNSTLEDLIRRLPGMEVEEGGSVKMDGKNVTSVKVDGKSFFGNNPAMATKNLPAEGVST
ncbi:MAG TPA: carboxypeptidase-like regulatory domain-containing protein, partial [Saprospiraceae bacterium]|nr:carboxypeptidase-like regulatory domain-containing protein [Saprospiraceae bacterium]